MSDRLNHCEKTTVCLTSPCNALLGLTAVLAQLFVCLFLFSQSAFAQTPFGSLSTGFQAYNSDGGSAFEVVAKDYPITITGLDLNLQAGPSAKTIEVYTRPDLASHVQGSTAGWTHIQTSTLISNGSQQATFLDVADIIVPANGKVAIYLRITNPPINNGGDNGRIHIHSGGTPGTVQAENQNIQILLGRSGSGFYLHTGTAYSFSGTVHYDYDIPAQPTISTNTGGTFNESSPGFVATISFDNGVTGFDDGDLTATNATVGPISGSGTTYTATITPDNTGDVDLNVAAGVAQTGAAGNLAATEVTVVKVDDVAPSVSLSTDSGGSFNESSPGTFVATVTFSEPVTGFVHGELNATNATVGALSPSSGSGTVFTATIHPHGTGDVVLTVAQQVAQDGVNNDNTAAPELTVSQNDDINPGVSISNDSGGLFLQSSPVSFVATVTFSEPVTGFTDGDLTATNAQVGSISGTGASYTATITPNGTGDVELNVSAGVAQDPSANLNSAANPSTVLMTDDVGPSIVITTDSGGSFNESAPGTFTATVSFSEPVTGFANGELTATNASVGGFTTSDNQVFTALITPDGQGDVALDVAAGVAQDGASNLSSAARQVVVAQVDDTVPTVEIRGAPVSHDGTTPFSVSIVFSEPVTGFEQGDVSLSFGSISSFVPVDARTYTVQIAPGIGNPILIDVNAGVAQDSGGNQNTAAPQVNVADASDTASPTATISTSTASHDGSSSFSATVTFSEPVFGLATNELIASNAVISATFTQGKDGDAVYTFNVTPTGVMDIVLSLPSDAAFDAAGNGNIAASEVTVGGTVIQQTEETLKQFVESRTQHILNNQPSLIGQVTGQSNGAGGPLGYLAVNGNEASQNVFFATSRSRVLAARDGNAPSLRDRLISPTARQRIDAAFGEPVGNAPSDGSPAAASSRTQDGRTEDYGVDPHLLGFAPVEDGKLVLDAEEQTVLAFGEADAQGVLGASRAGTWDIWTEIYGSRSNVETSSSSLWVGFVGLHYFLDDRNVIGLIGQFDWSQETNSAANSSADGTGWMVGPYIAGQFEGQNLFYEASVRYGQSDNSISPIGTYEDQFDTTRWMASAKLSGAYKHDGITMRPEIGFTWYEETQESYTDSLSNTIPETTITFGELRFGPTFSRTTTLDDGTRFAPTLGINGVYNFDLNDNNASQGTTAGAEQLRARVSAGFAATNPDNGITLTTEFFYDGLFIDDYETYGARARLTIPLD